MTKAFLCKLCLARIDCVRFGLKTWTPCGACGVQAACYVVEDRETIDDAIRRFRAVAAPLAEAEMMQAAQTATAEGCSQAAAEALQRAARWFASDALHEDYYKASLHELSADDARYVTVAMSVAMDRAYAAVRRAVVIPEWPEALCDLCRRYLADPEPGPETLGTCDVCCRDRRCVFVGHDSFEAVWKKRRLTILRIAASWFSAYEKDARVQGEFDLANSFREASDLSARGIIPEWCEVGCHGLSDGDAKSFRYAAARVRHDAVVELREAEERNTEAN